MTDGRVAFMKFLDGVLSSGGCTPQQREVIKNIAGNMLNDMTSAEFNAALEHAKESLNAIERRPTAFD